jgi:pyruvate formate lyase activating enzyme
VTDGLIFDIKKYSTNDGPGIRTTVFFKGCPLRCPWCHNPEGQSFLPELIIRASRCLPGCSECLAVCEPGTLSKTEGSPVLDLTTCTVCGKCSEVCPTQAIELVGRRLSAGEVMAEIEKDRVFHEESQGGATFSGGEPLAQADFLADLLTRCREGGIHATVDTCGYAPPEAVEKVEDKADLFLFDLKIIDEKKHDDVTGQPNRMILENLRRLAGLGKKIVIRLPLIAGVNDDDENIRQTADFLVSLGTVADISLLPYHKLGREKYTGLRKKNRGLHFAPPSEERLKEIQETLESRGFRVRRGE